MMTNDKEKDLRTDGEEGMDDTGQATMDRPEGADAPEADTDKVQQELAELKDKYLRQMAEFDNFRKRSRKEKADVIMLAAKDTLSALLPVLDDFDRAKKYAEDDNSPEVFTEGVQAVYTKLYRVLEQQGVKAMESTGTDFDPDLHEAITRIPAPSPDMVGKVIDTVEQGYYLNDKILRHAKVVVGQ